MIKYFHIIILILYASIFSQEKTDYFVFLNKNPLRIQLDSAISANLMNGHMKNINRIYEEGILKIAGPFDGGGGIFIIECKNQDELKDILNTDPAIKANRFNLEYYPMSIYYGKICKSNSEKMKEYTFIKYIFKESKNKDQKIEQFNLELKKILENCNETLIGLQLENNIGGIIILKENNTQLQKYLNDCYTELNSIISELSFKYWWTVEEVFCK